MANAAIIDLVVDDSPRIYLDAKKRNKFAAAETAFREIIETFIVCISSGLFAEALSGIGNRLIKPSVKIKFLVPINWDKVEWFEKGSWSGIKWKNPKYDGIFHNLKDEKNILGASSEVINDENIDKSDAKNILKILETRIGNTLR